MGYCQRPVLSGVYYALENAKMLRRIKYHEVDSHEDILSPD